MKKSRNMKSQNIKIMSKTVANMSGSIKDSILDSEKSNWNLIKNKIAV